MDKIIVIDNCSLIYFFKYYIFDFYNGNIVYKKLFDFLIKKIKDKEVILLDKVEGELLSHSYFKKELDKKDITSTTFLIGEINALVKKYTIEGNKSKYNYNLIRIQTELERYITGPVADLYLVAYCNHLKKNGKNPILITEESKASDGKMIEKLPIICKNEKIECCNIAYLLFELYKNELEFGLTIK